MQGNPLKLSMSRTVGAGLLLFMALAACTHFKQSPSSAADSTARSEPDGRPAADAQPPAAAPNAPSVHPPADAPAADTPDTGAASASSAPAPSAANSHAKPAQSKTAGSAKPKSRGSGSPKPLPADPGAPTAAEPAVAQSAKPAAPPPLDLAGLEQRLKDTHAIGVFTKLSLKNQVDDLLGAFRAYHGGQTQPPLPELRQRYDLLLLKVLTLLQDGDPPLASVISASREAIWALLADRDKFQKIQVG